MPQVKWNLMDKTGRKQPMPPHAQPAAPVQARDSLLDSTRCQLIVSSDPPFRILLASTGWLQSNGYDEPDVVGHSIALVQGAGTCVATAGVMASALQAHRRCAVRMLCYNKAGKTQLSDVEIRPLTERGAQVLLDFRVALQGDGQPASVEGKPASNDPTIRLSADAEFNLDHDPRTRDKACVLTEAVKPWTILAVNERWCALTGYSPEEAVGNTWRSPSKRPSSWRRSAAAL